MVLGALQFATKLKEKKKKRKKKKTNETICYLTEFATVSIWSECSGSGELPIHKNNWKICACFNNFITNNHWNKLKNIETFLQHNQHLDMEFVSIHSVQLLKFSRKKKEKPEDVRFRKKWECILIEVRRLVWPICQLVDGISIFFFW